MDCMVCIACMVRKIIEKDQNAVKNNQKGPKHGEKIVEKDQNMVGKSSKKRKREIC